MEFENQPLSFYEYYKEKSVDYFERALLGDVEVIIFSGILGFLWIMFVIDSYINFRQRKILNESTSPSPEILSMMTKENFIRARSYSLDRNYFNIFNSWYSMAQITLILMTDALPWLWSFTARSVVPWTADRSDLRIEDNLSEQHETTASLLFVLYVAAFSFLDSLPWKAYNNFILEDKYGLSKQPVSFFILDQFKSFITSLCLILPISYCLLYIIKLGGPLFYLHAWSFGFVVMIILMFIYPGLISPMFDKFVPLPDGTLKTSIEDLADRINFPLTRIFVSQGSKRSSHSHAYFYGFWRNKRIVLHDTLLSSYKFPDIDHPKKSNTVGDELQKPNLGCTNEEILAILSHELGHWQFGHITQNLIIGQINMFLMFFAFGGLFKYGLLFKTFGFSIVGTPDLIKLVLIFQFIFSPYNAILEFVMTLVSRQNEFQADEFSSKLGMGKSLMKGLVKLQKNNLSFPIYDRWYSIFYLSHPPLLERIKAIKENESTYKM